MEYPLPLFDYNITVRGTLFKKKKIDYNITVRKTLFKEKIVQFRNSHCFSLITILQYVKLWRILSLCLSLFF